MKYGGSFTKNFSSANGSNNLDYKKDVILDEVSRLIEFRKPVVVATLKDSGYKISPKSSKKVVIDNVVKALYNSEQFRNDIAKEIVKENSVEFSNAGGEWFKGLFGGGSTQTPTNQAQGIASGAGKGAGNVTVGADPVSAIAGAIGSIFSFAQASKEKKTQEEITRRQMYEKLLGEEKKNWIPFIVVGGILLVGGLVAYFALRKK